MIRLAALAPVVLTSGLCVASTTYKVDPVTEYTVGCYRPCACPISVMSGVSGTFRLTPVNITGTYDTYDVTDIAWSIPVFDGDTLAVSGAGTYEVFSEVAVLQRLQLDLVVGDEPERHFDSGWIAAEAQFPAIDVDIAVNGFYCLDWAFFLEAQPLPADITGDGAVNVEDLVAVILAWGDCPPEADCPADVDGSGAVTVADLVLVILSWTA